MAEVGRWSPFFQVWGGKNSNFEVTSVGYNHDPLVAILNDVWITELCRVGGDDGVSFVLRKCVTAIGRVGDVLSFRFSGVQGVDGNDSIGLVWEESRSIIAVNDDTSGEDPFTFSTGEKCDLLVLPCVEILRGCMAPMLVSCNDICRIV